MDTGLTAAELVNFVYLTRSELLWIHDLNKERTWDPWMDRTRKA